MKKIFIAAILLVSSSCIKVVDPESNYITGDQLASSADALAGMVRAIPVRLVNYQNDDAGIEQCSYHGMLSMLEMMTTDMVVSGTGGYNTTSVYTYGNLSARGSNRGIYPFYMYYGYIKAVNDVIGLIDPATDDTTLKHYLGIAKAYRALFYMQAGAIYEYKAPTDSRYAEYYVAPEHDLTELTVPIVTETTTGQDVKNNPRATFDTLYEFILSDLKDAETLLADYTPTSKVYPSLAVVYGLYARAYMEMASHKNATENYTQALNYAQSAITTSGCSFLTEDQWNDPKTGFNDMTSQNSWMLACSISEGNTGGQGGGFHHTMLFGTETTYSSYGWRVGRSLNRKTYEAISDKDFRKLSWLGPDFFASETHYDEETGKWAYTLRSAEDTYTGNYRLTSDAQWLRNRITIANGFLAMPWIYPGIKFRCYAGNYTSRYPGCATDLPIMRVEEMYFIKAEAQYHLESEGEAQTTLKEIMDHRITDGSYTCTASGEDLLDEIMLQKRVEFWGEGINFFDAKRLGLGVDRGWQGIGYSRYQGTYDIDGTAFFWTIPFPTAEEDGNPALQGYNNPYMYNTAMFTYQSNADLSQYYGIPPSYGD